MTTSNNVCTLRIDIRSFWHAGTGRGSGLALDAVCQRDANDLPVLPGRHIRGLVREAVELAEQVGLYTRGTSNETAKANLADTLFGPRGVDGDETYKGQIRFSDGKLPDADQDALRRQPELIGQLFDKLFRTAIDPKKGSAKSNSLRGMEVAIPMTLECHVQLVPGASDVPDAWIANLQAALPLVRAVGGNRSRGMGRAVLSLEAAA